MDDTTRADNFIANIGLCQIISNDIDRRVKDNSSNRIITMNEDDHRNWIRSVWMSDNSFDKRLMEIINQEYNLQETEQYVREKEIYGMNVYVSRVLLSIKLDMYCDNNFNDNIGVCEDIMKQVYPNDNPPIQFQSKLEWSDKRPTLMKWVKSMTGMDYTIFSIYVRGKILNSCSPDTNETFRQKSCLGSCVVSGGSSYQKKKSKRLRRTSRTK
jgi:hypothetical protein